MKKFGFDISSIQSPSNTNHGGGEYASAIFRRLLEYSDVWDIVGFARSDWDIPNEIKKLIDNSRCEIVYGSSSNELISKIESYNLNTFYSALPEYRGLESVLFQKTRSIMTQHGLRDIECATDINQLKYNPIFDNIINYILKSFFSNRYFEIKRRRMQRLLECYDQIVCPSMHTVNSILYYLPKTPVAKLNMFYAPKTALCDAQACQVFSSENNLKSVNYFMLVSGSRWEKNSFRAIECCTRLILNHPQFKEFKIYVCGGIPAILPRGSKSLVRAFPYVSESALASLFANAFCLIYPSLNEGFGYPPIEAMAHHCPVVASSAASITEIAADGADYFDPRRISELGIRLLRLRSQPGYRTSLIQRGSRRYESISAQQAQDLNAMVHFLLN